METPTSTNDIQSLLNQQSQTIKVYQQLCDEKDKRIILLEEKIKHLENELEIYIKNNKKESNSLEDNSTPAPNNLLYDFSKFNIEERNPLMKIEPKNGYIFTMIKLDDERIACGFINGNIIIFGKKKI